MPRIAQKLCVSTSALFLALVACLAPMSTAQATDDVNVLPTATMSLTDGQWGLVGKPFNNGQWAYSGQTVGSQVTGTDVGCNAGQWQGELIMCDLSPTTNVQGQLTQWDANMGYTSGIEDANSVSFIVLDLGKSYTFSSFEAYQMEGSDGKVTDVELWVSNNLTDTWPAQSDSSWSYVTGGTVPEGSAQTGSAPTLLNTSVLSLNVAETSGRYVMLYFQNDGTYGSPSYIEVAGAKLFGHETPPQPELPETAAPEPVAYAGIIGFGTLAIVTGAVVVIRRRSQA